MNRADPRWQEAHARLLEPKRDEVPALDRMSRAIRAAIDLYEIEQAHVDEAAS